MSHARKLAETGTLENLDVLPERVTTSIYSTWYWFGTSKKSAEANYDVNRNIEKKN